MIPYAWRRVLLWFLAGYLKFAPHGRKSPAGTPALQAGAAPVRKQLGFRTIFNLLGPLTNPAKAEFQLIGVPEPSCGFLMLVFGSYFISCGRSNRHVSRHASRPRPPPT